MVANYVCNLCEKKFTSKQSYWNHKNAMKTTCLSKEQCEELLEKLQSKDAIIVYFKNKLERTDQELLKYSAELEKKEKEIEFLKHMVEKMLSK